MNPFRAQSDLRTHVEAPPDAVVDAVREMVGQFADPFAFLRELVQNSLDAEAREITVQLRFDPPERGPLGALRVAITDDGAGMTPDTITRCLLVLFRSSKEGDSSKIGRFGVGFFSVFAARPESVVVETGDGAAGWRLELRTDYTYELSAAPPRTGTTVSLRVLMTLEAAQDFARRSEATLARWCPHVRATLRLSTVDVCGPGLEIDRRIDAPFDLDAQVKVRHDDARAKISLLVGVSQEPTVMFFNRGILLHESPDDAPPGATVKIESPALHHTLSRDDIKRDEVWARAVALARTTARKPLREALSRAFTDAVTARAKLPAGHPDRPGCEARVASLARSVAEGHWGFTADEIRLPLVHPLDGACVMTVAAMRPRRGPKLYADGPDALTVALCAREIPVVDLSAAGAQSSVLKELFEKLHPQAEPAGARFLAPAPREPLALSEVERALLDALTALMDSPVSFGDPVGALSGRLAFVLPHSESVVDVRVRDAFTLGARRTLVLSRAHPTAAGARRAANHDLVGAALLLGRSALVELDALDAARDADLLRRAVTLAVT